MTRQRAQSKRPSLFGVLRALWSYRQLVWSLVRRDLQQRSAGAVWGHAWLVLQPTIQILIYTVIFGAVLGARLPGELVALVGGGSVRRVGVNKADDLCPNYRSRLVARQIKALDWSGQSYFAPAPPLYARVISAATKESFAVSSSIVRAWTVTVEGTT